MRLAVLALAIPMMAADAATLTVQTNRLGPTPELLAYNSGHFFPGSNTRDWWRYAGVNGVRIFLSPSSIEPSDDLPPVGDGVTSQAGFLNRRAALRADPLNTSFINWPVFLNNYENRDLHPVNHIRVNYALREWRTLGVQICAQITASQNRLPIADADDWGGKWELWQHYYAQAFYLGREFDVERYQMFNEPNHPNAGGLTRENFLMRLQLASDAIQCALADVNALCGKTLAPRILAPVTSGSAEGSFAGWGDLVVTNRHMNFLGELDPDFRLIHTYDYHQYNATPGGFGSSLAALHNLLTTAMAPEPRLPTAISEYNVHAGAVFDTMPDTLDSPAKYARFGAISVQLMANGCNELYAFKFSQTRSSAGDTYPVQKNAMHYTDNTNAPYNIGGITKAGEVWRLFNKAFATGRERLGLVAAAGADVLDAHASYDPARARYHLFSANNTSGGVNLSIDLSAWDIPAHNRVLVEEVSETVHGAGRFWTNLSESGTFSAFQAANTVWLLTIPRAFQQQEQIVPATDDAEVRDGANSVGNYGNTGALTARNHPTDANSRSVSFIKFQLPVTNFSDVEFAVLSLQASTISFNTTAHAHVYALHSNNWSQATLTWDNAPNLRANGPAGVKITNNIVQAVGESANIVGQIVVSSTQPSEKLIDVTDYLRSRTNAEITFLISQDARWDVTLPSLEVGDTQPDGVRVVSMEGATPAAPGPRLRLVMRGAPPNEPPIAADDIAFTTRDTPVLIDVLANDSDPDGDALAIQSFTQPANGSVNDNGDGTLTYTPAPGFSGTDRFDYVVHDDRGGAAAATVSVTVYPPPALQLWTNLAVRTEAFVRGGSSAGTNPDEVATGYIMVKHDTPPFDFARKAYFEFDLAGLNVDVNTQAVFTVHFQNTFKHRVQLWGLNQAYPGFDANITWNNAQANETNSNNLLVAGAFTAAPIGSSVFIPVSGTTPFAFTVPRLGDFVFNNRIVLVLSAVEDPNNNVGGLRILRTNSTLQALAFAPEPTNEIREITLDANGIVTLQFLGNAGQTYHLQAATNIPAAHWLTLSTNVASADGAWAFTDWHATNHSSRFYRAVLP